MNRIARLCFFVSSIAAIAGGADRTVVTNVVDLGGQTVRLEAGVVLEFRGGQYRHGILVGDQTAIVAPRGRVIFDDVTIRGTWNVGEAWSSWFKTRNSAHEATSRCPASQWSSRPSKA